MRVASQHSRHAFTLLELMLVMVLIVVFAALAVPLAQQMLVDARIAAAGDIVRARMAETRANAMDQGLPWKLGFLANTGVFQLAPEGSSVWNGADQTPAEEADLIRDELPKDIVFALNAGDISSNKEPGVAGSKWEVIAIYLPDGSARDDTMIYFGKQGIVPMRTRLRALTGAVGIEVPVSGQADEP